MLIVQDRTTLESLKQSASYAFQHGSLDTGAVTLEGSRPFKALGLWLSLLCVGRSGYRDVIERIVGLAEEAHERILRSEDLEAYCAPQCNVVVFRCVANVRTKREQSALNQRVADMINAQGRFAIATASMPDRDGSDADETWLRLCLVNPETSIDMIEEVLAHIRGLARSLEREMTSVPLQRSEERSAPLSLDIPEGDENRCPS
jgi:L-2,4-diaminobutyrate decarboxylase